MNLITPPTAVGASLNDVGHKGIVLVLDESTEYLAIQRVWTARMASGITTARKTVGHDVPVVTVRATGAYESIPKGMPQLPNSILNCLTDALSKMCRGVSNSGIGLYVKKYVGFLFWKTGNNGNYF